MIAMALIAPNPKSREEPEPSRLRLVFTGGLLNHSGFADSTAPTLRNVLNAAPTWRPIRHPSGSVHFIHEKISAPCVPAFWRSATYLGLKREGDGHALEVAVAGVPGVRSAHANTGSGMVTIEYDPQRATTSALKRAAPPLPAQFFVGCFLGRSKQLLNNSPLY
jgi:hypothetical protein